MLADDWSKTVFLRNDRYLELHDRFAQYYSLRLPKFGRALAYHRSSCDLYAAASGKQQLNLEE